MIAVFIPGLQHPNDISTLEKIGCSGLFGRTCPPIFTDCFEGPGRQPGKLIYVHRGRELPNYVEGQQDWLNCGDYWLGTWKEHKPTPELLAREHIIDGQPVILADECAWIVPSRRAFPRHLAVDRLTGNDSRVPSPEHREYLEKCDKLFEYFISDEFQERVAREHVIVIENGLTFAAEVLSKNYHVNRDLLDHLGLITDYGAFDIARVACGLDLLEQVASVFGG